MSDIIGPVKFPVAALHGRKGVYLCYFIVDTVHVRLCGDPNPSLEVWGGVSAGPQSWLPIASLLIGAWEASIDESFHAIWPERQGAWNIATAGESGRDRAWIYNEYRLGDNWHVTTMMPKGTA